MVPRALARCAARMSADFLADDDTFLSNEANNYCRFPVTRRAAVTHGSVSLFVCVCETYKLARNRWPRDARLRLDHLLLNPKAAKRLIDSGVDREVRGAENASDHAPAWVVLRDASGARQKPVRKSAKPARAKPKQTEGRAAPPDRRLLLVIDGDSFAHRSYHALPKTILRRGRKPAGAILGFANLLLRLHREEQPRAVLVGWDTLEVPTYRHEKFPAYQSGREFDDALVEQLEALPEFVAACGFQNAKAPGYEADDILASAAAAEEKRRGTVLIASSRRRLPSGT